MNVRELKTQYTLDPRDLPNQAGMNVVTIAGVQIENYFGSEGGRQVPKQRRNLWFREFQLPLRLNNTRVDVLASMLGEETDAWVGRKIGLYVGALSSYGETKPAIMIHLQLPDQGTPSLAAGPAPGGFNAPQGGGGFRTTGQAIQPHGGPQPPTGGPDAPPWDDRPIGKANADKFRQALAEQGARTDDCLMWLRRTDGRAWEHATGKPLEDWPRGLAPLMQRFLREYQAARAAPPAANPLPAAAEMPPHDEIPF